MNVQKQVEIKVRSPVTCFYCWKLNRIERLKWTAKSPKLCQDERLGEDQLRFVATRFTPDGLAIDPDGVPTSELACANCHLPLAKESLKHRPFFVSIAGTPSSGKTFFQTAMIHKLRQVLPMKACLEFQNVDTAESTLLTENETLLFSDPESEELVTIEKTQEFGDLYRLVQFDQELVSFPKPFLFLLKPTHKHPNRGAKDQVSRIMAFYDNAGESFEPGRDSLVNPVTRHLGLSNVLMFCLDLSQEDAFQSSFGIPKRADSQSNQQLNCLLEMERRSNEYSYSKMNSKNLIVVVTKFDQWNSRFGIRLKSNLWKSKERYSVSAFDTKYVEGISAQLREGLRKQIPDFVRTAERISKRLMFIPVSAIGSKPETSGDGVYGVRPNNINPVWAEVPLVYSMAKWCGGLIPYAKKAKSS